MHQHLFRAQMVRDPATGRKDRHEAQEAVALAHLRDRWVRGQAEYFVLCPETIKGQLVYQAEEALTDAEEGEVIDAVMNDDWLADALHSLHNDFNALVRTHATRVLAKRS